VAVTVEMVATVVATVATVAVVSVAAALAAAAAVGSQAVAVVGWPLPLASEALDAVNV
jgi:hypothetical protein